MLLLSRQSVTAAHIARLAELLSAGAATIDWGRIAEQSAQHRIAPLVGSNGMRLLKAGAVPGLNAAVISLLYAAYRETSRCNQVMLPELLAITDAAKAAGIPVIVRKGGHLAIAVYRDPGVRPMGDLDVMIDRKQARELIEVLRRLGYEEGNLAYGEIRPLTRKERLFWHLHGSDLPKLNKALSTPDCPVVSVDVNVSLALPDSGYDIPIPAVMDRADSCVYDGRSVMVLAAEDTVIDLCAHIYKTSTTLRFMRNGRKHRRLLKYVDIAEFVRAHQATFCWRTFLDRVTEFSVETPVYYALAHLEMLFPGAVPAATLAALRAGCREPDALLNRYGQWDLAEPMVWHQDFLTRFFDSHSDLDLPESRSLV